MHRRWFVITAVLVGGSHIMAAAAQTVRLVGEAMVVSIETGSGRWTLEDTRSGVRWPSEGMALPGDADAFADGFASHEEVTDAEGRRARVLLTGRNGVRVAYALVDDGRALEISFGGAALGDVRLLEDALAITAGDAGYVVVPCREGLLVRADSGIAFERTFGTSDYEGCHMNMFGFVKQGSALVLDWDDAYVFPTLRSLLPAEAPGRQRLTTSVQLRATARSIRVTPLGKGGWDTIAEGYRRIAEAKGLAVTWREKTRREAHADLLPGAANVKLWTCLARRMSEDSTREESVKVRWTFDEAAQIAEHLRRDLGIERCLFILGGWTEGGYDCRHPDNLPANPECGGNLALADAVRRIQALGYVAALHDNYQDMYADARSWDPALIEKDDQGNLKKGGRWLGGRAYMVCAPKQLELARRPQNLPETERLFGPWCYFIDTTYAVGPRECSDPAHPIDRNDDILWKCRLSDYAREVFGLFGSECGREWALPHSDWFEGLVGVSGRYYHNLDPGKLGATVIPFWEMVYHDCQICHGKYGYAAEQAAEYVVHHALCARTLHYHSMPDHLYWQTPAQERGGIPWRPTIAAFKPLGTREFEITYEWEGDAPVSKDWRVFVHFAEGEKILFQDDHAPEPVTSRWQAGQRLRIGPHRVTVPEGVKAPVVTVYAGLFGPEVSERAPLALGDAQRRVLLGELTLTPELRFSAGRPAAATDRGCFVRADGGWAEGMHPTDAFLKNTHEVLGPLHAATAHMRLTHFEFLSPDGALRQSVYGSGEGAVRVTVNLGQGEASVPSVHGGEVALPRWGLLLESPAFVAFHAVRWAGRAYADSVLFTIQSRDGLPLDRARAVRVYHGFGSPRLTWRGQEFEVKREADVTLENPR